MSGLSLRTYDSVPDMLSSVRCVAASALASSSMRG